MRISLCENWRLGPCDVCQYWLWPKKWAFEVQCVRHGGRSFSDVFPRFFRIMPSTSRLSMHKREGTLVRVALDLRSNYDGVFLGSWCGPETITSRRYLICDITVSSALLKRHATLFGQNTGGSPKQWYTTRVSLLVAFQKRETPLLERLLKMKLTSWNIDEAVIDASPLKGMLHFTERYFSLLNIQDVKPWRLIPPLSNHNWF
jgi:hypothetical protein